MPKSKNPYWKPVKISKHALPLPLVFEVMEVFDHHDPKALDHVGSFVLIAPDRMSGRRARYSVIRVDYQTGQATTIGRELSLKIARQVAKRPATEDGKPLK
jgi:hypothetical protein